jgi:hypothetical protein
MTVIVTSFTVVMAPLGIQTATVRIDFCSREKTQRHNQQRTNFDGCPRVESVKKAISNH